jgi:hypothetical protein
LNALLSRLAADEVNYGLLSLFQTGPLDSKAPRALTMEDWLLFADSQGARALRTPGWYLVRPAMDSQSAASDGAGAVERLYLKPDDRWEFNEVLARRPEIGAALAERLDDLLNLSLAGAPLTLPPLPAELLKGG